jgi:hypothetical protein
MLVIETAEFAGSQGRKERGHRRRRRVERHFKRGHRGVNQSLRRGKFLEAV